ncbi:hypothetical protein ACK6T5_24800, partial [Escherichia coli]
MICATCCTGIDVRAVEQGDDAWHKLRLGVITA